RLLVVDRPSIWWLRGGRLHRFRPEVSAGRLRPQGRGSADPAGSGRLGRSCRLRGPPPGHPQRLRRRRGGDGERRPADPGGRCRPEPRTGPRAGHWRRLLRLQRPGLPPLDEAPGDRKAPRPGPLDAREGLRWHTWTPTSGNARDSSGRARPTSTPPSTPCAMAMTGALRIGPSRAGPFGCPSTTTSPTTIGSVSRCSTPAAGGCTSSVYATG